MAERNAIEWWIAKLEDGRAFTNGSAIGGPELVGSIDQVHEQGDVRALSMKVRGIDEPINAECVLGERLHVFTQRAIKQGASGSIERYLQAGISSGETINMPVIEILRAGGPRLPDVERDVVARLYVHPIYGKIFTTGVVNL